MFYLRFISFVILFCSSAVFAVPPSSACRVTKESIQKYGTLINNAGCVITKEEEGKLKFLMVYNDNGKKDRGWAFPGGTHVSPKSDKAENYSINVPENYSYDEPAICTASREAREELGSEVIIGDLVLQQEKFIAFSCYLLHPEKVSNRDNSEEIKAIKWLSLSDIVNQVVPMRFQSNIDIVKRANEILSKK